MTLYGGMYAGDLFFRNPMARSFYFFHVETRMLVKTPGLRIDNLLLTGPLLFKKWKLEVGSWECDVWL